MFKKFLAMTMAATLTIGMVACGGANSDSDSTTSDSNTQSENPDAGLISMDDFDGEFILGLDATFDPYGYTDEDGNIVGFDIDLAQEVCDRNNWTLTKQPIDWNSKDMELDSGSITCIWNGFTKTGREDKYTWTVPYVDSSIVVCVAADSDIATLDDLAGKIVMVQEDSSGLSALNDNEELKNSFGSLEQIPDYNSAFMNLESGAVDAVVVDIGVARKHMSTKEGVYKMLDEEVVTEQYAVGFKLGNEEIKDVVEKTLFDMLDDGTFDEIAKRWADEGIPDMVCLDKQR